MITDDLARMLIEEHPLDTARVLEQLSPAESWEELRRLEAELRPPIIEGFSEAYAARVLLEMSEEDLSATFRGLPSEISADILPYLPDEVSKNLLETLPQLHADEIEALADYPEDTVGSIMSPDFVALRQQATVQDALTRLRRMAEVGRNVNYVYVVDDEKQLTGVLLMRDLVLALPHTKLQDIMIKNVVRAYTLETLTDVADKLRERRLLALPVVDDGDRLKGVVLATQLVSELQEEGFEDAQKMFGAGSDERASSPAGFAIRKRLPWLSVNLATAFLAGAVVGAFEGIIAEITILAAFLPVVAGQGGNAGAQALAVTLRSLALDEMDARASRRILFKEALVGLSNGLATGLLAAIVAVVISQNMILGVVIMLAMVLNLVIAGIAGAGIPILLERFGQDPAQSSNILLTTVTDVVGFAAFLGLALAMRQWLLGV